MNKEYCINIYSDTEFPWLDNYRHYQKKNMYGTFWVVYAPVKEKNQIIKHLKKGRIRYKIYEKRWERSSDYRKTFFDYYQPPYRCRYCNKRLKKKYVVIDHIYPVSKGKSNIDSRMLIYLRGISSVNDVRNLAPSCFKCNKRKGDKLGLWYIRGILGKYRSYWVCLTIFRILLLLGFIILLLKI